MPYYYDWRKYDPLPRNDLQGWYQYIPGETGNNVIYDDSGNTRTLNSSVSNTSFLQTNIINGQPALRLPGTQAPLKYTGSITVRHIFVIASFDNANFSGNEGLLTDAATNGLIVGGGSGVNRFYNFNPDIVVNSYRKNGVSYPQINMLAPMSNQIGIIEMKLSSTMTLDSLQIGQDRNDTSRKYTGYFVEMLVYSSEKNDNELREIYEYFAMRYRIWRQTAAGLYIFPFVADRRRTVDPELEHYLSEPYSGSKKALIRNLTRSFQLPFSVRRQAEFEAAEAFNIQHYPLTNFVYEDYKYYPYKERTLRFTSSVKDQGSDITHRFNYSFEAEESV